MVKQDKHTYVPIEVIGEMLNIYQSSYQLKKLSELLLKLNIIDHLIKNNIVLFSKNEMLVFLESYISKDDLCELLRLKKGRVEDLIKEFNVPVIELGYKTSHKFINRQYIEILNNKRRRKDNVKETTDTDMYKEGLVSLRKVREHLGFHPKNKRTLTAILNEYNILVKKYNGKKCIDEKDLKWLLNKQAELLTEYSRDYCDFQQATEIITKGSKNYFSNIGELERYKVPLLLKAHFPKVYGFYKIEILHELKKRAQRKNYLTLNGEIKNKEINNRNAYSHYLDCIDFLNITYASNIEQTVGLWNEFVSTAFTKTRARDLKKLVTRYVNAFTAIVNNLEKDIFYYTANELNKILFNNKIAYTHQAYIYAFCKVVNDSFVKNKLTIFDFSKLKDPSKRKAGLVRDLTRYSLDEYENLFEYCTRLEYHKSKAIKDVENLLKGSKYIKYDSCWLYVMTHLTNNWRHSSIVDNLPRIDLSGIRASDLEWFKNNDLTLEEANDIIFQIGRYVININKNGAEGVFNVSEPLKISFATAVCICELRNRLFSPLETNLLWLGTDNRTIEPGCEPHKSFFREFQKGFKFANRKMNRTLTTLIWSIMGLSAAKVSRSHFDEETTKDHYIKLTDKQLEMLMDEIFARDKFGYSYQLLVNMLFGKTDIRGLETKRIVALKERFDHISKLEASAGLMNRIQKEEDDIQYYLSSLSPEKVREIYFKCLTNTLYSKEKNYLCIFPDCKYKERDNCHDCPCSIANVYSLSNLLDEYLEQINHIINDFENSPVGERKKMANHFFLLYNKVFQARQKYGDNIIYSFIGGGKERLNELSLTMPEIRDYITITISSEN